MVAGVWSGVKLPLSLLFLQITGDSDGKYTAGIMWLPPFKMAGQANNSVDKTSVAPVYSRSAGGSPAGVAVAVCQGCDGVVRQKHRRSVVITGDSNSLCRHQGNSDCRL